MKRKITLAIAIGLCLALVGCGAKEVESTEEGTTQVVVNDTTAEAPTEAPEATEAPTPEPTEVALGGEDVEAPTPEPTAEPTTEVDTEDTVETETTEVSVEATEEPTAVPEVVEPTAEPVVEATPEPTVTPEVTKEPVATEAPKATEAPTPAPTEALKPTEAPVVTPAPTPVPTAAPTPEPTPEPNYDAPEYWTLAETKTYDTDTEHVVEYSYMNIMTFAYKTEEVRTAHEWTLGERTEFLEMDGSVSYGKYIICSKCGYNTYKAEPCD